MRAFRKFDPYLYLAGHAEAAPSEVPAEMSATLAGLATLAGGHSQNAKEGSDEFAHIDAKAAKFDQADNERRVSLATLETLAPSDAQNENERSGPTLAKAAKLANPSDARLGADEWDATHKERAAIIEYDGGIPRAWAEGFARLDPDRRPGDVPLQRWQTFVEDCGRFLDGGWAGKAVSLGWGAYDLFGCDRTRPFARIDKAGLLWLLNGDKLIALAENTATIETRTGARQTYRCKPNEPGRVLAWEIAP